MFLVFALIVIGNFAGAAWAERVRTTKDAKLFRRPGESAPVVMRVKEGELLTVVGKQGRWLKVRIDGRIGWVVRTTVEDEAVGARVPRNTQRRAFTPRRTPRSGWSSANGDRTGADSIDEGEGEKPGRSGEGKPARQGEGDDGSGPNKRVAAVGRDGSVDDRVVVPGTPEPGRSGWAFGVSANGGMKLLGATFRSNGNGALANYDITSPAPTVQIGAEAVMAVSGRYLFGGAASYAASRAAIRYKAGDTVEDISYTGHDLDVRALAGYDFRAAGGLTAWARLGYHYDAFLVDKLENLARLPSEALSGPTVGATVEMPRLTGALGARVTADVLVAGSRLQSQGLEDGATSRAAAAWVDAAVTYRLSRRLWLDAGYGLGYARTEWTGDATKSIRGHDATEASRSDITHSLSLGVGTAF